MSDAIGYCPKCTTNVECHLMRACMKARSELAAVAGSADGRTPWTYPLFKLMHDEHGLILTDTELRDIVAVVREMVEPNNATQTGDTTHG